MNVPTAHIASASSAQCRHCHALLTHQFIDLVHSPPSNSFLTREQLNESETFFPLKLYVCERCWLVQIDEYKKAQEIFSDSYIYFSSYSTSWLQHCKRYVEMMIERFAYGSHSQVVEIASNDGYLLQYFHERGVPTLGIEPTANTAEAAQAKGIETICEFFGADFAKRTFAERPKADLLLGNNVLAHVPDINDFVQGLAIALAPEGVVTMEFPHLMQLVEHRQFDTIYHEHFSYLSLTTVRTIFAAQDLEVFDVEEISTHGGSLRIFAKHRSDASKIVSPRVLELLRREQERGMEKLVYYQDFQEAANAVKNDFVVFLIEQKRLGKKVAAYGAAAKGNTLLNYCGVKPDLLHFVADASPHKQEKFLPGTHIEVAAIEKIAMEKPDYVVILPWNIREEIMQQLIYIKEWGGQFVIAIPRLQILS